MKLLQLLLFLTNISLTISTQPNGKYCGNIVGNDLSIIMNQTTNIANISANIFGTDFNCPNENYLLKNNMIDFPKNKSDCMNKILLEYGGCPCPPVVNYNNNDDNIIIQNEILGNITLTKC